MIMKGKNSWSLGKASLNNSVHNWSWVDHTHISLNYFLCCCCQRGLLRSLAQWVSKEFKGNRPTGSSQSASGHLPIVCLSSPFCNGWDWYCCQAGGNGVPILYQGGDGVPILPSHPSITMRTHLPLREIPHERPKMERPSIFQYIRFY